MKQLIISGKNVFISVNSNDLAEEFAGILSEKLIRVIRSAGIVNIALSGGNAPKLLFEKLAEKYRSKIDWNMVNFWWVDERCVPPDSEESNYGNAHKFLLSRIGINVSNIHRIRGEADPETESVRYSSEVKKYIPAFYGLPCFDIVLLGIGEDGHTASIFPDQMNLMRSENIYDIAVHPSSGQKRITMTGKIINNSADVVFYISGKNKAEIIKIIFNNSNMSSDLPAGNIIPVNGDLAWYLDNDAAEQLDTIQ